MIATTAEHGVQVPRGDLVLLLSALHGVRESQKHLAHCQSELSNAEKTLAWRGARLCEVAEALGGRYADAPPAPGVVPPQAPRRPQPKARTKTGRSGR
jgi:hypothetical protein